MTTLLVPELGRECLRRSEHCVNHLFALSACVDLDRSHQAAAVVVALIVPAISSAHSNGSIITCSNVRDTPTRVTKVEVLRELVARIDPEIEVDAFYGDIAYADDARRVAAAAPRSPTARALRYGGNQLNRLVHHERGRYSWVVRGVDHCERPLFECVGCLCSPRIEHPDRDGLLWCLQAGGCWTRRRCYTDPADDRCDLVVAF